MCIMIPMDTIKTRLVTQARYPDLLPYKGIFDCALRVAKEEGMGAFYRGLAPRLISVVPMIGIQFGIYEYMKKVMLARPGTISTLPLMKGKKGLEMKALEEAKAKLLRERELKNVAMEVAADDDQPFPIASSFTFQDTKEIVKKSLKKLTR